VLDDPGLDEGDTSMISSDPSSRPSLPPSLCSPRKPNPGTKHGIAEETGDTTGEMLEADEVRIAM